MAAQTVELAAQAVGLPRKRRCGSERALRVAPRGAARSSPSRLSAAASVRALARARPQLAVRVVEGAPSPFSSRQLPPRPRARARASLHLLRERRGAFQDRSRAEELLDLRRALVARRRGDAAPPRAPRAAPARASARGARPPCSSSPWRSASGPRASVSAEAGQGTRELRTPSVARMQATRASRDEPRGAAPRDPCERRAATPRRP